MAVEQIESTIRLGEWFTIGAALLGPILAVQAQKFVEASRAKRDLRERVFRSLMATRAARLSAEHVQSLNMIDIAFYGTRFFGLQFKSTRNEAVRRAWRDYFDSLETETLGDSNEDIRRLAEMRNEKFITLISAMAVAQNYDFDSLDLRKKMYSPTAHWQLEAQHELIRNGLANILEGKTSVKVSFSDFFGGTTKPVSVDSEKV